MHPSVELYSALILGAVGYRPEQISVIEALSRTAGWLAHWNEAVRD